MLANQQKVIKDNFDFVLWFQRCETMGYKYHSRNKVGKIIYCYMSRDGKTIHTVFYPNPTLKTQKNFNKEQFKKANERLNEL